MDRSTDVLPLLNGSRSHQNIVATLNRSFMAYDVAAALNFLTARGYLVSGEHTMSRECAAYWSALGASPRWAEERLAASKVAVTGDRDRHLTRKLKSLGVEVGAYSEALCVYLTQDYLDASHADINQATGTLAYRGC